MSFRRMIPFLLLNILVSAAVVLAVLWWWDGREGDFESAAAALPQATQPAQQPSGSVDAVAGQELPAAEDSGADSASPDDPGTHVVQAGDTLGQISLQHDVSVEAIMSANGIDNPNFLSVGQELIIPEPGAPLPEDAQEDVADEGDEVNDQGGEGGSLPTPIPTEPAVEGDSALEIANIVSAGQITTEAIQIVNNGSREATLRDWKITDQLGNTYTFGGLTLFGDGAGISLHTGTGQDSATDLFWGLDEAVWNSGDLVVLYDAEGNIQAELQVP